MDLYLGPAGIYGGQIYALSAPLSLSVSFVSGVYTSSQRYEFPYLRTNTYGYLHVSFVFAFLYLAIFRLVW